MSAETERVRFHIRGPAVRVAIVAAAVGVLLTGCSVVKEIHKVASALKENRSTIDAFTTKISTKPTTPFTATYVTTGSSPATVVYAVNPPHGLAFTDTPTASSTSKVDIVVNSTGEFACTEPGTSASGSWTCQKLDKASAATENKVFDFYTPSHWVNFLRGLALTAAFAGDKVTSSSMTVNGFPMSCVDLVASGVTGTSTICTTSQGILGYVKVASDSTSFEITSFSSTPTPSLFQVPPGATITTVTTPTT